MKKFLAVIVVLFIAIMIAAYFIKNGAGTETTTEKLTTAETAKSEIPAATTVKHTETSTVVATKARTTVYYEPATFNPAVITGAPNPSAGTYTGYEPLHQIQLTAPDPDNSRGLSEKAAGFGFGIGKNGAQPSESLRNQALFDQYNALALDTKSTGKVLHLTFDCGYENGWTGKILDTLKDKHVQAAFFCTLSFIKSEPELAARMITEGHILGNHSSTHPAFPTISRTKMAQEIQDCDNYLRQHFGYTAPFFRFPEGSYSISSLDLVQSLGYKAVFWSVAYTDWDQTNQKGKQFAFDTVTSRLHPGAVILLHAVSSDNAAALGDIIDWAREQGYKFMSL